MPFNTNIIPGRPPVLWSDVNEAFIKVNENFDILVATVGDGSGLTPIDFASLDTDVTPTTDNLRSLGNITNRWKSVFTGETTVSDPLNGLWSGTAQIKGVAGTVNLPANSTVGGDPITGVGTSLIIDPDKTFFKEIQVNNDLSVVATTFGDTVNFLSGSGVSLAVSSGADSITFSNTGVLSVAAGTGITAATVSGVATITNAGVRSLQSTVALPAGRSTGAGININGTTGDNLRVTNTGVISISSGVGITVSTDVATGDVTITNSAPAVNAFTQIEVNGDSSNRLAADAASDVLNITSDATITLSKTVGTDTLNIAVNPVFDLKGSVFGDDSSILVDAVGNYIYGNVSATTLRTAESQIALGSDAGKTSQSTYSIAIGQEAGKTTQGTLAVAVGYLAGSATQSQWATAIGYQAGTTTQGQGAVAVGFEAGKTSQGTYGVAIGHIAGEISQGSQSIAIGPTAGYNTQGSNSIAVGYTAGQTTQGAGSIALGYTAAQITQGTSAVAIGWSAGQTNQGAYAIAIGYRAGFTNQNASSIVLNASGVAVEAAAAGFFVNPIRPSGNGRPLMYDTSTSELFSSSVLEFIGSTLSTSDSSAIQFDSPVIFQTSITVDGNITLKDNLILEKRLAIAELEGVNEELNIYSDWAKDTGVSIYSASGLESVTLTSNRIAAVVTNVGPSQKQWIFDTNGQIQFPDTRYQNGAAISITDLKVLVAACADFAAFKTAIAALA